MAVPLLLYNSKTTERSYFELVCSDLAGRRVLIMGPQFTQYTCENMQSKSNKLSLETI